MIMTKSSGNGLSAALLIKKITGHLGNHQIWMLLNNKLQITCHIYIFLPLKCWAIRWGKMGEGQKKQQLSKKKWAFNYVWNLFAIGFIMFHHLLVSQIDLCHLKLIASPDARRTAVKLKRVRWSWGDWNEAAPNSRMTLQCLHNPFITFMPLNGCYFMQESDSGESFATVTLIKSTPGCESGPGTIQVVPYTFENVWRVFLYSVGTLNPAEPIGPLYHSYLFPWKASQLV